MNAKLFNEIYPVGSPVLYWPIAGEPKYERTRTRSEAWTLGHFVSVVLIEGHTGGVDVNHIQADGGPEPQCTCTLGMHASWCELY